jgi:DNA helicase II / ATP-dependent DNA helicase PcrA
VRGRADAVFSEGDGLVVVDWKTGPPPTAPAEIAARSAQLAAYRQAFADLHGLAPQQVRAVFHHVRENLTIEEQEDGVGLDDVVAAVGRSRGTAS